MSDILRRKAKRVLVIANPAAGRAYRRYLDTILQALRDRGCDPAMQTTSAPGDAERHAQNIDFTDVDVLAIAGGDGTINEVLNGLQAAAPPLAIIPIGTANVLAAEVGLGSTANSIADTIAHGEARRICLGLANGRRFAVMASLGLDAEVVRHVSLDLKRYIGKGAYVIETMRQLFCFDPPAYELSINGKTHHAYGVIIANGRYFGGRFVVAPNASIRKPCFDVCYSTNGGKVAAVRYLAAMIQGRLAEREDYRILEAPHLRIEGPVGANVQADGDIITHLPAVIDIEPDAVEIMFPKV
ncbi:MAG: diacylglycerol/lipid kinase family protein [Geminicoccales bacterium]